MDRLFSTLITLADAIDDCLSKDRLMPALTLIYSGIDVLARLEVPPTAPVRQTFESWVDRYLLKQRNFAFSATDLYAARCGIVHAFSVESDLTRNSKAKRIVYTTGETSAKKLEDLLRSKGLEFFAVNLKDLNQAFRNAISDYVDEVVMDSSRATNVNEGLRYWFVHVPMLGDASEQV
jgi:hypothetical protein